MTAQGLESTLHSAIRGGRKILVPYVTAGLGGDWLDIVRAVAAAGADAVEIGIPFSDPVMDGPVIQEASQRSLDRGSTPRSILAELVGTDAGVPLAVMTYFNIAFTHGLERFAGMLQRSSVSGSILPDLPLEESEEWRGVAARAGIEHVLLAAPTTPDSRLEEIASASRGFVYGVGLMGVTGERDALAASALHMARRLKKVTDKPVLIGVGVSDADQARQACEVADGVVVGSALVRRLLHGAGADGAGAFIEEVRTGLDKG